MSDRLQIALYISSVFQSIIQQDLYRSVVDWSCLSIKEIETSENAALSRLLARSQLDVYGNDISSISVSQREALDTKSPEEVLNNNNSNNNFLSIILFNCSGVKIYHIYSI